MTAHSKLLLAIPADCDPARVRDILTGLRDRIAVASAAYPLSPDLTEGRPTALALQLLAATALSLRRAGAFAGFGPNAFAILTPLSDRQES
jgi:hypothetical protein